MKLPLPSKSDCNPNVIHNWLFRDFLCNSKPTEPKLRGVITKVFVKRTFLLILSHANAMLPAAYRLVAKPKSMLDMDQMIMPRPTPIASMIVTLKEFPETRIKNVAFVVNF